MASIMPEVEWDGFSDFVAERLGLHFPPHRQADLRRGLDSAAAEFGFAAVADCARWLMSAPLTREQVEILASHLTVGETYFFREPQTFDLLAGQLLPPLIAARRPGERRLRFWSTACCTGEEPYSLAILLQRLLPDLDGWNITILATDINPGFLRKGAAGVFREWSFRDAPGWLKEQYFRRGPDGHYTVLPTIRRMVSFSYLNLAEDVYPALLNDTNAMDIILCRNVLMYFAPAQVQRVVGNLQRALVTGGWLVVSPVEVLQIACAGLTTVAFPGITFFRRTEARSPAVVPALGTADAESTAAAGPTTSFPVPAGPPPGPLPAATPGPGTASREPRPSAADLAVAQRLYRQGYFRDAAELLTAHVVRRPDDTDALLLLARILADEGRLTDALARCDQGLTRDKLCAAAHYLRATILVEQGTRAEAVRALQRTLYLDPDFILAHFALGNLRREEGKVRDAERCYRHALALLARHAQDEPVPESDGLTVGRLAEIIDSMRETVSVS